ncbi:MAG TPA: class I SAM-dependent methyltransferase [bacterium]
MARMNLRKMKELYVGSQHQDFYDQLLGEYDQMMDWESRLERESPFFQKIIADYRVKTILDAGCGTGRHCFHFGSLGVESIVGADVSEKVVELAQKRADAIGGDIRFVHASFTNLADRLSGPFNLVCCLGNSISHLLTYDDLELALKNFRSLISARGVVLLHCLNWQRRLTTQERFFNPKGHPQPDGEKLFFRFLDYHDELVTMNLLIFQKESSTNGHWSYRVNSTTLRPWRSEILRMAFKDADLSVIAEYGGTDMSAYSPTTSPDYVVLAKK